MRTLKLTMLLCASILAGTAYAEEAASRVLLFARGGFTTQALEALAVGYDTTNWSEYAKGRVNIFKYDVVISGFDVDRRPLDDDPERLLAFVETGGVFLGLRRNAEDLWLPSPVKRDKAYEFGEILQPEHPIFNTPHSISGEMMTDVHGGSIYDAFWDLGKGWLPLVSTGAEQGWDEREAQSDGPHFGIIELQHGRGRIIICQMIPTYAWFNDHGGEDCEGKLLFENMMAYVQSIAPEWARAGRESVMPESYHERLGELLPAPTAGGSLPLDEDAWQFESHGPFSGQVDRRCVFTISHPHEPSQAGGLGRVQRTVKLDGGAGGCYLRFYVSDDYCGGWDREFEGDRSVAKTENRKADMRFAELLVEGQLVWELDVLGMNPRPAARRFYLVDISKHTRGKNEAAIALQVSDRQASGEAPFATDVFWAGVELFEGLSRLEAREMKAEGFVAEDDCARLPEGVAGGALSAPFAGQSGDHYIAVRLRDEHTGQSELSVSVGGKEMGRVRLTADDYGWHWASFGPARIEQDAQIELRCRREGEEQARIREIVLLPRDLVERKPVRPEVAIAPPCYQPGRAAARESFAVRIEETAGVAREGEVVSHGMPFAYGALGSVEALRVLSPAGEEVPRQVRQLATWPDGSVMFALVTFPVSVGPGETAEYRVEYGSQVSASAQPAQPVTVAEEGDEVLVDTGALTARLSKTTGTVFESATLEGREMVAGGEPWAALVTAEDGKTYSSAADSVTEVQILESGPLRVMVRRIGRHQAEDGATLLEYEMIQEFYAGSPMTRLRYYFTHKEDSESEKIRQVRLQLTAPWAQGDDARAFVWLDGDEVAESAGQLGVNQHDLDAAKVRVGDDVTEAGRTRGWARLSQNGGLSVATRWWWEKFPKAVEVGPQGIALDLIPQDSHTVFSDGPFVLYQGECIGHEVMIAFEPDGSDPSSPELFQAFRDRLLPTPDPEYACATLALGEVAPENELRFPAYEARIDRMHDGYIAKREKRKEYGMENFGDDTFEWGYGPSYTFWSNQEYDHHHGFLMEYLRSGDRRYFEIGEQAARHYEEVDCFHWAPGREYLIGAPHHHNTKHIVDEGWFPDHALRGASNGHSWVEGLLAYWMLTGDVRAEETARAMGEWYLWTVENGRYGAGGQERGPGWTLIALSALYRTTGDERFKQAGDTILDWMAGIHDPVRGVISVPISEQPSYEGGTAFMHGIVGRGLGRFYEATGEERAMRMCLGIGQWLTTEPMGPPARFWYKQAPSCKHGYGATSQCLSALSYPYRYTGDEWFAEMSEALVAQTGPSVRSAAWTYTTLAHMAERRRPFRVEIEGEPVVAAPEVPAELTLRLTNTTAGPLAASVRASAPAGLAATAEPATVNVDIGGMAEVTLTVSATASAVGRTLDLTVQVVTEQKTQERKLSVRVVVELVRQQLGAEQATLTGAFVLAEHDGRKYAYVPREARFRETPWPADGDAGAVTWKLMVPVAGEYTLLADCYWLDDKGNSFYAVVDDGEPAEFGNDSQMKRWHWVRGKTYDLADGEHTVSLRSREDGSRVRGIILTNAPR